MRLTCLFSVHLLWPITAAACLLLPQCLASAADMDILVNDIQRRDAVAPYCAALKNDSARYSSLQKYHKGLCLLYGINSNAQPDKAVKLMRAAAQDDLIEAQLALADFLQKGSEAAQTEALQWYERAATNGDARATLRKQRLENRIAASSAAASSGLPEPPPGTIINPSARELQALYRDGYHCHIMPRGERWCHNTLD